MRRFADYFQFWPQARWQWGWWDEQQAKIQYEHTKTRLKTIPVFVIDDVVELMWATDGSSESEKFDLPDQFELVIAPPFEEFWIEYNMPKPYLDYSNVPWSLHGFHCFVKNFPSQNNNQCEIKFVTYISFEEAVSGPLAEYTFTISESGTGHTSYEALVKFYDIPIIKEFSDALEGTFNPCLIALHLASCPKVEVKDITPSKRLIGRKARLRGEREPIKYKVLDIGSLKVILKTEGQIDTVGWKQALTAVRGHWRTYTAEKPLFGRFVGKLFVKDHSRGSKEFGQIEKSYNVKPPIAKS